MWPPEPPGRAGGYPFQFACDSMATPEQWSQLQAAPPPRCSLEAAAENEMRLRVKATYCGPARVVHIRRAPGDGPRPVRAWSAGQDRWFLIGWRNWLALNTATEAGALVASRLGDGSKHPWSIAFGRHWLWALTGPAIAVTVLVFILL